MNEDVDLIIYAETYDLCIEGLFTPTAFDENDMNFDEVDISFDE